MMRPGRLGTGLALGALLAAGAALHAADDTAENDQKTIQGKWTTPAGDGGKVTYTFRGKTLKVEAPTRKYTMTVTLDARARPEKTIDFKIDEGPDDAKGFAPSKGIYKFVDKDTLVWSFRPQGERPTTYEQVGYEQILNTLTREKD